MADACEVIDSRLPGGLGAATPFFPQHGSSTNLTYKFLLTTAANSSSPHTTVYIKAGQAYIAAQLNVLSGAAMPPAVRQAQVFLATKYFSVVQDKTPVSPDFRSRVEAAEQLLNKFNNGMIKGLHASCNKLQK